MVINEFKLWLEGYSENITVAPTPQQWARIKEKLAEISPEKKLRYYDVVDIANEKTTSVWR